ncbi:hypothetical protein AQUCO_07700022v1 [Aquilegia coerulea]|uniref:Uncharacterized protein n=1 Tax=Aquilegia coerulea TaxID=218851 RepID=A0A2G5C839_AQUCA|nr:hypothetical protein AQUCO_07700022v1 [Aquilegia coerulea]
MKVLEDRSGDQGLLGKDKFKDVTVQMVVRENRHGRFVSMMFISKQLPKGKVTICVPAGEDFSGWVAFKANIETMCCAGRREVIDPPSVTTQKVGGAQRVVVC